MCGVETRAPTITDLGVSFGPFGILLGGAIIAATFAPDVLYACTEWTIRVAMLLMTPALVLFILNFGRRPLSALWRLWWTFAFLAAAIHVAFAFFGMDGGELKAVPLTMGKFGAILVTVVIMLWTLDIFLAWMMPEDASHLICLLRLLSVIGVVTATLYATFNRTGTIYALGIALVVIAAGALISRIATEIRRLQA